MYSEFSQVSLLSMANLQRGIEFNIVKRPAMQFQEDRDTNNNNNQVTANSSYTPDEERGVLLGEKEEKSKGEYQCDVTASKELFDVTASKESAEKKKKRPGLGELQATDYDVEEEEEEDDHDGFKTPTSVDHKIPVMKQCPPAPRKPKPSSNKRKASSTTTRRSLQLDLSQEVESLFPNLADLHRKIKKARTEDNKQ